MSEAAVKSDAKWYIVHTYSNFEKKVAAPSAPASSQKS
jgi:transcriptional antiterminator NusG